jgi:hypothetical protein
MADAERHQLAGAKPGVGGKADQQLVARIDDGGQVLDLPHGPEVHVPPDDAWQPDSRHRVAGDPAQGGPLRGVLAFALAPLRPAGCSD